MSARWRHQLLSLFLVFLEPKGFILNACPLLWVHIDASKLLNLNAILTGKSKVKWCFIAEKIENCVGYFRKLLGVSAERAYFSIWLSFCSALLIIFPNPAHFPEKRRRKHKPSTVLRCWSAQHAVPGGELPRLSSPFSPASLSPNPQPYVPFPPPAYVERFLPPPS